MVTVTLDQLARFAQDFWVQAGGAKVFLFYGEMGAGKTTVIEALCAAKGVRERMGSPTFSIINQYGYAERGEEKVIYHIDLYRLKDEEEITGAGVEDCVYSGAICFVEWPQKAPDLFDESSVKFSWKRQAKGAAASTFGGRSKVLRNNRICQPISVYPFTSSQGHLLGVKRSKRLTGFRHSTSEQVNR